MTRSDATNVPSQAPADFPALREFFTAYLHEDYRDEFGSVVAAAQAFRKDASSQGIAAVKHEWKVWTKQLENKPLDQWRRALRHLGAAWRPQSQQELDRLGDALVRD